MWKALHVVNVCLPVGCLCWHLRGVFLGARIYSLELCLRRVIKLLNPIRTGGVLEIPSPAPLLALKRRITSKPFKVWPPNVANFPENPEILVTSLRNSVSTVFVFRGISYFADFLPPKHPFILRSSFLLRICRFMKFWVKCNTFKSFKMVNPRWHMLPGPFLVINYVIMTSLLLLKIIYMLAIFLFLSNI